MRASGAIARTCSSMRYGSPIRASASAAIALPADDPGEPAYMRRNRQLRILGVLGGKPDCWTCLWRAMRRACAPLSVAERRESASCRLW